MAASVVAADKNLFRAILIDGVHEDNITMTLWGDYVDVITQRISLFIFGQLMCIIMSIDS